MKEGTYLFTAPGATAPTEVHVTAAMAAAHAAINWAQLLALLAQLMPLLIPFLTPAPVQVVKK